MRQLIEDIEAFGVDDDMPELDRFALLFERGHTVQRLSVMLNLPTLVADHGGDACAALLCMIIDAAPAVVRAAASDDDFTELAVPVSSDMVSLTPLQPAFGVSNVQAPLVVCVL